MKEEERMYMESYINNQRPNKDLSCIIKKKNLYIRDFKLNFSFFGISY